MVKPVTVIVFRRAEAEQYMVPVEGCIISGRHVNGGLPGPTGDSPIGKIVRNPDNPDIFGIRNISGTVWTAQIGQDECIEVPDSKAVPINPRIRIVIGSTELQIRKNG